MHSGDVGYGVSFTLNSHRSMRGGEAVPVALPAPQ